MNAAQNQNAFHAWSDEAKAMAIQARVLSGEKLGQLVCRLQRHSGRSRESCWRFVLQIGLKIRDEHRRWTEGELDTLREHIATHSVAETAKVLGRSVKSVRCALQRNELKVREIRCDWMSIESLARILHVRKAEILSWIDKGWLEATVRVHGKRSSYVITPAASSHNCLRFKESVRKINYPIGMTLKPAKRESKQFLNPVPAKVGGLSLMFKIGPRFFFGSCGTITKTFSWPLSYRPAGLCDESTLRLAHYLDGALHLAG
jgi:hypothetical protein